MIAVAAIRVSITGQAAAGGWIAPKPCCSDIHGQHPIGEGCLDVVYPSLEAGSRRRVVAAPRLHTLAQFAQRQDAEEQSGTVSRREKSDDPGIGAELTSF
jgi:hypothetical protein